MFFCPPPLQLDTFPCPSVSLSLPLFLIVPNPTFPIPFPTLPPLQLLPSLLSSSLRPFLLPSPFLPIGQPRESSFWDQISYGCSQIGNNRCDGFKPDRCNGKGAESWLSILKLNPKKQKKKAEPVLSVTLFHGCLDSQMQFNWLPPADPLVVSASTLRSFQHWLKTFFISTILYLLAL